MSNVQCLLTFVLLVIKGNTERTQPYLHAALTHIEVEGGRSACRCSFRWAYCSVDKCARFLFSTGSARGLAFSPVAHCFFCSQSFSPGELHQAKANFELALGLNAAYEKAKSWQRKVSLWSPYEEHVAVLIISAVLQPTSLHAHVDILPRIFVAKSTRIPRPTAFCAMGKKSNYV